ncbi:hypothetical protein LSCM1_01581 [Leishmania martiniquensis]|uniref:Uncharacterized protein n=1 Tax=Leishmania martiniquensis TaxID=1580590 RepID=A0A836GG22_9TRYP|nr:hypothetical protein LSCM1_01581 [Leishmania martiniquensis]
MSSLSSARPSRASLARALDEARLGRQPRRASSIQLRRYLVQWFPRGLWSFIYRAQSPGSRGVAAGVNVYRRFCRDPPRVSHEWSAALQLVELARLVDEMPSTSPEKVHHGAGQPPRTPAPESDSVVQATEHLLRYGVFPPCGWALTLQLLYTWRTKQPPARPQLFPTALSPPAAAQLLHHLSRAPPSPQAWHNALCLYHLCSTEAHTPPIKGQTAPTQQAEPLAPPRSRTDTGAHSAFLKAMRHMTLTTLLRAGEWERGLHFYHHTLYQRDLPGPITTAYLVQQLGRARQWAAVLRVYELCVKLLHAQRHQHHQRQPLSPHRDEWLSRQWGTTLSIAMAAAQNAPGAPTATLAAMVRQLEPDLDATPTLSAGSIGTAPSCPPPLVRLNGHFLSAVQALPSEKDRSAVLRLAWRGSLLDIFKIIRGLLSKHKWEEALALFEGAMHTAPARTSSPDPRSGSSLAPHTAAEPTITKSFSLSRKEIGETRLSFLHEATIDSVTAVVAALNRHRPTKRKQRTDPSREGEGNLLPATAADGPSRRLTLNDREVECVLSKTLALREEKPDTLTPAALAARKHFWRYCLELLACNYGALPCGEPSEKTSPSPREANERHSFSLHSPRRTPTPAALSFLLRHPRLPWHVALQLLQHYGVRETRPGESAAASTRATRCRPASLPSATRWARTCSPPTPRSLALAAAVELLRRQGQLQVAEKLALQSLDMEMAEQSLSARANVSLSAALLEVVQYPTLRNVLLERVEKRLSVEGSTLFHLLQESTCAKKAPAATHGDDGAHERPCGTAISSPPWWAGSADFFHHPSGRALTVVWLLMQHHMRPQMTTTDAARQDDDSLLASLFLCIPPPPMASVAAASLEAPPCSWLMAYPAAVHCEVVHVIKCLTSLSASAMSSASSSAEEKVCYAKRWVWTRRYLSSLAAHFSTSLTGTQTQIKEASYAERQRGGVQDEAVAREAYYNATFEAVVSLLDTSMPQVLTSHDSASHGRQSDACTDAVADAQDGDVPHSSAQRVQQLQQLLERAIARYGCLPPTHMVLPNQLNRLLPPRLSRLPAAGGSTTDEEARQDCLHTEGARKERCAVALHLVRLLLGALQDAGKQRPVEPAMVHNLLKLCCRISEYDQASLAVAEGAANSDIDHSAEVSRAGATLVRLQCELCGLHTVRSSTLSLLYHLCAAAQSRASACGHTVPRQVALETTCYLLEAQTAASAQKGTRHEQHEGTPVLTSSSSRSQDGQRHLDPLDAYGAVQARHCELFFALIGWEDALEVWYRAFPHEVLTHLSSNPQAVEACLSFGESTQL